jgi:6-phosphogluconolactonase (cycloisomerase 2 family)
MPKILISRRPSILGLVYALSLGWALFTAGCGGTSSPGGSLGGRSGNGSGGGTSGAGNPPPGAEYLYQFSFSSAAQVSELNTSTGALAAPVEATPYVDFEDGGLPVLVTRNGKFLYEEGFYQNPPTGPPFYGTPVYVIWGFAIGGAQATLTSVPNTPVPRNITGLGSFPNGMAIDPQGRFLFCSITGTNTGTNGLNQTQNSIMTLAINESTGELTPSSTLISTAQAWLIAQFVDPLGEHLYAVSASSSGYAVEVYSIASNGGLTEIQGSPFFFLDPPEGIESTISAVIDPTGQFLYVSALNGLGDGGAGIYSFTVDPVSNNLTLVTGSPFRIGAPTATIFDFTYNFLFANYGSVISAYSVTAGTISSASASSTSLSAGAPIIDPNATFLVDYHNSGTASTFTINQTTGALGLVPGSPFRVGSESASSLVIVKIPN